MRFPPSAPPAEAADKPGVAASKDWIIVASREDRDVVEYVLEHARSNGKIECRVLWADSGPMRLYPSINEYWEDLLRP